MDDLLRALALLRKDLRSAKLVIVGEGPESDQLLTLSRELGLEDCVDFVGAMPHGQVLEWLRSLDAFVLASKKDSNGDMDGIPVAMMEAMSQAVPVVSTRISGIPELVLHEQTGLLAEPGNPDDLARQLFRLASDRNLRDALAIAGSVHTQREFGRDVNLDRLMAHIRPSVQTPERQPLAHSSRR
jgi:glycosyltransferase involved in cell wall biosynthesis